MHYNRVTSGISEISRAVQKLIRAEMDLIQAEIQDAGSRVSSDLRSAVLFSAIAMLGVMPFLAFLVIGLGRILDDNYWLSALIISAICFAVGGVSAYRAVKRITAEDLSFPHTRRSLDRIMVRTRSSLARARLGRVTVVREAPESEIPATPIIEEKKEEAPRRAA